MSAELRRFMNEIENFPQIMAYWDFEADGGAECHTRDLDDDVDRMSHGNAIMARFFRAVWTHQNEDFDFIEACSVLDESNRRFIINFMERPYWP